MLSFATHTIVHTYLVCVNRLYLLCDDMFHSLVSTAKCGFMKVIFLSNKTHVSETEYTCRHKTTTVLQN